MTIEEAIVSRHSVRAYKGQPLTQGEGNKQTRMRRIS